MPTAPTDELDAVKRYGKAAALGEKIAPQEILSLVRAPKCSPLRQPANSEALKSHELREENHLKRLPNEVEQLYEKLRLRLKEQLTAHLEQLTQPRRQLDDVIPLGFAARSSLQPYLTL